METEVSQANPAGMVIKELKVSEEIQAKWVQEDLQDIQDLKVMMEIGRAHV